MFQVELEKLNKASEEINRLELELDVRQAAFYFLNDFFFLITAHVFTQRNILLWIWMRIEILSVSQKVNFAVKYFIGMSA